MRTKLYKLTFSQGSDQFEYADSLAAVAGRVRGSHETLIGVQLWDDQTNFDSMGALERMAHKQAASQSSEVHYA